MGQEFEIGGDKPPADIGKKRVKHKSLSFWKAYFAPLFLAGQGLSLLLFINSLDHSGSILLEASFWLFTLSAYIFEATGMFSPEDDFNQPLRLQYFRSHKWMPLVFCSLGAGFGLFLLTLYGWSLRVLLSLSLMGILFFGYAVFRWKEIWRFKPVLVSLAWILGLIGFSEVSLSKFYWEFGIVFFLLILDSLWLDLKDQSGDENFGIQVWSGVSSPKLILFILHMLLFSALLFISELKMFEFQVANLILLLCGILGLRFLTRFGFGITIPFWSYWLLISLAF